MIDQAELKKRYFYDPEAGTMCRLMDMPGSAKAGDLVGSPSTNGYLRVNILQRGYPLHRLAWLYMTGSWPSGDIDHIDRDRRNNRWANLREVTRSQNNQNRARRGHGETGRIGVCWDKSRQRWMAYICRDYKYRRLGKFNNLIDAVAARMAAERELFTHQPTA